MKKSEDRSSRKCINPWYKFLAIFCVAFVTLFMIFQVNSDRVHLDFLKKFTKDDSGEAVLIAASGVDSNSQVAPQLELSRNFLVVDESNGTYEYFSNDPVSFHKNAMHEFLIQRNIETVIAGTMEIDTYQMLSSSNIVVYTGVTGTVEDILKQYKKHKLVSYSSYFNRQQSKAVTTNSSTTSVRKEF